MTTVGYGDLHPDLQLTRLFAVVFLPFAVVLLAKVLGGITGLWMEGRADEAEQEFLRRELTLADLTTMDTNSDGRVSFSEFLSFMLFNTNGRFYWHMQHWYFVWTRANCDSCRT